MNDPFTCPKNSLSNSSLGIAAQFTRIIGAPLLRLRSWIVCASSSLPVPDSPSTRIGASVGAASATCSSTRRSAGLSPTISPCPADAVTSSRSSAFSSRNCSLNRSISSKDLACISAFPSPSANILSHLVRSAKPRPGGSAKNMPSTPSLSPRHATGVST